MNTRTHPSFALRGFSLIELMVAMLLSLLLLAGVVSVFLSSRKTYETTDQLSRLQENGRFALDVIVQDLRSAGFNGCSKRIDVENSLNGPTGALTNFAAPVQGFDAQGSAWVPALDVTLATGAVAAGDAIAIRFPREDRSPFRLVSSMASDTDPVVIANTTLVQPGDIVQVSDCRGRGVFQVTANTGGVLLHDVVAPSGGRPGNATNSAGAAFTDAGELSVMRSVVYFLRPSQTPGAGNALWRRVSGTTAAEEVVEGIESVQFQYGEDTDNDAEIDVDEYRPANLVSDWSRVLTVQVALLVRSTSEYDTDRDRRTYQVLDTVFDPVDDRRLRQVFTTTVALRNSAT